MAEESKKITVPAKAINLTSPTELVNFATTLKTFIIKEKLYTEIQRKNYVNVEGWQFAGAATGILPIIKELYKVEGAENEVRYRAEVELRKIGEETVVGYGVAICSNREHGREKQDEYVIASMAQTRAIGKAYRNMFAWLMKMAGYEPTPAEEVINNPAALGPDTQDRIDAAKTAAELAELLKGLSVEEQKTAAPLINKKLKEIANAKSA